MMRERRNIVLSFSLEYEEWDHTLNSHSVFLLGLSSAVLKAWYSLHIGPTCERELYYSILKFKVEREAMFRSSGCVCLYYSEWGNAKHTRLQCYFCMASFFTRGYYQRLGTEKHPLSEMKCGHKSNGRTRSFYCSGGLMY
jgi:hypothetical protein